MQQLRYAIEIANSGSMNEAAKKLFVSQPSLSNAIKELESELGITIFERTNRGISISVEGMEFPVMPVKLLNRRSLWRIVIRGKSVVRSIFPSLRSTTPLWLTPL